MYVLLQSLLEIRLLNTAVFHGEYRCSSWYPATICRVPTDFWGTTTDCHCLLWGYYYSSQYLPPLTLELVLVLGTSTHQHCSSRKYRCALNHASTVLCEVSNAILKIQSTKTGGKGQLKCYLQYLCVASTATAVAEVANRHNAT